jgi:hypothetical protein
MFVYLNTLIIIYGFMPCIPPHIAEGAFPPKNKDACMHTG